MAPCARRRLAAKSDVPPTASWSRQAAEASAEDTHAAIAAAREAFDTGPWPHTPERERAEVLRRTADLIDRDRKDFVRAEALDTGKRIVEAEYDMDDVVACLRYYAGIGGTDAGRVVDTGKADAISRVGLRAGRRLRPDHAVELPSAASESGRLPRRCWRATRSCSSRAS